ncbi:MAG TPA: RidA family protein [Armatimonadetes bacterium]|nr:RidA family protein [Armatimonadota bacterium]
MAKKECFISKKGPAGKGPYSSAVVYGDLVFVSGQGPVDPTTGEFVGETIEEQTRRTIQNLQIILEELGLSLTDVVKTTVFLKDLDHFSRMNAVYAEYFGPNYPARTTVQAGRLPFDILVEIEAVAARPGE